LTRQTDTERDVAAASALQAEMWPGALPSIAGFDCAAASVPAAGVGGDLYDVFGLGRGAWGVLLGDVSGKGVAAGLVATALQGRVQTAARHARLDAVSLATAINDDVFASTHGRRYTTLVYGELDEASRTLHLVNAGHGGVMLVAPAADSGAASISTLDATGPAVGLFADARFEALRLTLPPGHQIVAFTDGVNEALDEAGHEFGLARVGALLASVHRRAAAEQAAALLDAVRMHRGSRQTQDDVTVMVIRSLPS
jgi:phosphoserine phosphatase RsbU/P